MNIQQLSLEELKSLKEEIDEEIKKKKKEKKPDVPMDLSQFVEWTKKSKQRYLHIIGSWSETVRVSYKTKAQWEVFIKRNLRPAKLLEPFTDDQISEAFSKIENSTWITKYTLDTVVKFIV